jgi:hypothetical protein
MRRHSCPRARRMTKHMELTNLIPSIFSVTYTHSSGQEDTKRHGGHMEAVLGKSDQPETV